MSSTPDLMTVPYTAPAGNLKLPPAFTQYETMSLGDILDGAGLNPAHLIEEKKKKLDSTFAGMLERLKKIDAAAYVRDIFSVGNHILDDWLQYVDPPRPHGDSTYFRRFNPNTIHRRFFNAIFKEGAEYIAIVVDADLSKTVQGITDTDAEPLFKALEGIIDWGTRLDRLNSLERRGLEKEAALYSPTISSASHYRSRGRLRHNHARPGVLRFGDMHT